MAIAPIDLQVIFTQVEKVGKTQAAQREGHALSQAIQGAQIQRKTEEQIKQVNEAQNTGEGTDKVKDRHPENKQQGGGSKKEEKEKDGENDEKEKLSVLRAPGLGSRIDISL